MPRATSTAGRTRDASPPPYDNERPVRERSRSRDGVREPRASVSSAEASMPSVVVHFEQVQQIEPAARRTGVTPIHAWNALLRQSFERGLVEDLIEQFHLMQEQGAKPDAQSFELIISACADSHGREDLVDHFFEQAIARGEFRKAPGLDVRANQLNFRARDLFTRPDGNPDAPVSPSMANALIGYHIRQSGLDGKTCFVVRGFTEAYATHIEECMLVQGLIPAELPTLGLIRLQPPRAPMCRAFKDYPEKLSPQSVSKIVCVNIPGRPAADVWAMVQQLRSLGIPLDKFIATAMTNNCRERGETAHLGAVIKMMRADGVEPDEHVFYALAAAFASCGNVEATLACFRETRALQIPERTKDYNIILWACEVAKRLSDAEGYLREMQSKGLKPNSETYLDLIGACHASPENRDKAVQYLKEGAKAGVFESSLGMEKLAAGNRVDFHWTALAADAFDTPTTAAMARTVFAHHLAQGAITDQTIIVPGAGQQVLREVLRDCMDAAGLDPVDFGSSVLASRRRRPGVGEDPDNNSICLAYKRGTSVADNVQSVTTAVIGKCKTADAAWLNVDRMLRLKPFVPVSNPMAINLIACSVKSLQFERLSELLEIMQRPGAEEPNQRVLEFLIDASLNAGKMTLARDAWKLAKRLGLTKRSKP
jgi:pentatricopeptide repeat protein